MVTVPFGPAVVDLTGVRAGDQNLMAVTLTTGGDPLDLTGATVTAQARKVVTDLGPPALSATVVVTDAAAGQCSVRWPGEDVRTLLGTAANWTGVWDLQYVVGSGEPVTVCGGKFTAEQDVTR